MITLYDFTLLSSAGGTISRGGGRCPWRRTVVLLPAVTAIRVHAQEIGNPRRRHAHRSTSGAGIGERHFREFPDRGTPAQISATVSGASAIAGAQEAMLSLARLRPRHHPRRHGDPDQSPRSGCVGAANGRAEELSAPVSVGIEGSSPRGGGRNVLGVVPNAWTRDAARASRSAAPVRHERWQPRTRRPADGVENRQRPRRRPGGAASSRRRRHERAAACGQLARSTDTGVRELHGRACRNGVLHAEALGEVGRRRLARIRKGGRLSAQVNAKEGLGGAGHNKSAERNIGLLHGSERASSNRKPGPGSELAWQQSFGNGTVRRARGVVGRANYLDVNTYANSGRGSS